ncbi:MAG TPA: translation initiation factor [Planctomycetota bacterium]|nr:translation initiation factor [Planctomycetota bacterium]
MARKGRNRRTEGEGWVFVPAGEETASGKEQEAARSGPAIARLRIEKRRGKPVTVVAVEGLDDAALREIERELRSACAAGGTRREGEIEIQGDHRETVRPLLSGRGLRVKG